MNVKKNILTILLPFLFANLIFAQIPLEVEGGGEEPTASITSNSAEQIRTLLISRLQQLSNGRDLIELKVPVPIGVPGQFIEAEHIGGDVVYKLFTTGSTGMIGTLNVGQTDVSDDEITVNDIGMDGDAIIRLKTDVHTMIFGANPSNEGIIGTTTDSRLALRTNNINRAIITKTGDFGVGTPGPAAKMHIREDGVIGTATKAAIIESVTSKRPLLLFSEGGSDISNGMAIEYDGSSSGINNNLRINTSAGEVGMMVKNGGTVGIKGPASNLSILRLNQDPGITRALEITNSVGGNFWGFKHASGLQLDYNGSLRGTFNDVNGTYTSVSDISLKSNIVPLANNTLEKVMMLNPVSYTFKEQEGNKKSIGFIAQEIEKIYPELIAQVESEEGDLLTLSYAEFGVIAIKAIQEQQREIELLKNQLSEIDTLKKGLQNLQAQITAQQSAHTAASN